MSAFTVAALLARVVRGDVADDLDAGGGEAGDAARVGTADRAPRTVARVHDRDHAHLRVRLLRGDDGVPRRIAGGRVERHDRRGRAGRRRCRRAGGAADGRARAAARGWPAAPLAGCPAAPLTAGPRATGALPGRPPPAAGPAAPAAAGCAAPRLPAAPPRLAPRHRRLARCCHPRAAPRCHRRVVPRRRSRLAPRHRRLARCCHPRPAPCRYRPLAVLPPTAWRRAATAQAGAAGAAAGVWPAAPFAPPFAPTHGGRIRPNRSGPPPPAHDKTKHAPTQSAAIPPRFVRILLATSRRLARTCAGTVRPVPAPGSRHSSAASRSAKYAGTLSQGLGSVSFCR